MAVDEGLVAWVEEAMAPVGAVTGRAMMGGRTFYCDGVVFAITASSGGLWFKADAEQTRRGTRRGATASPSTWAARRGA